MTRTRCRNREERITISKIWDNMRTHKRHSRAVEIKKGSGLRSVKYENVGTHQRHSRTVEIEKGNGLRSVKWENVGTHKRHSLSVEIDKGSGLRSVKCENVGTHKRHSLPVEIEKWKGLRSVKCKAVGTHKQHLRAVVINMPIGQWISTGLLMGTIVTDYPEHLSFHWCHFEQMVHPHPTSSHRFNSAHTEMDYDHLHTVFHHFPCNIQHGWHLQ